MEYRLRCADGQYRWVYDTGEPRFSPGGKFLGYIGSCVDITDRKRAEEQLAQTQQRMRTVIASAPMILFALDAAGVFRLSEGRGLDSLGLTPSEVVGRSVYDVYRDAPQVLSAVRRALAGEAMTEVVEVDNLVFETHYIPVFDNGRVAGVNGVAIDITERKRAEEELRQAQAAQFEISLESRVRERTRIARELHDTLPQSFQGLLLRFQSVLKMLPERPLEARHRLQTALDHAAQAITDARDAIQGLRSLVAETDDLAQAITAVGEQLMAHSTDPDPPAIVVEVEGSPRTLDPVVRDEAYRIAVEALRNAFSHARARRIAVEIRYGEAQFRLLVRDDGKGIDQQTIWRQPAGHFGLHGMRERAEIVGGRLEVRSRIDSGTEIELSIPGAVAYGETARRSWLSRVLSGNTREQGSKQR